ncbi:Beta-galactosidase [Sedimentisphaera salicampi]|uniref:beta-galactosidase n=2 Tax=Sedimentisphaera salicampi TaxID=1941349 RepID=A0A1W6LKJ8_9BACT|nr:Beta-galactosidase [Sedimentisphaera salicampi]
MTNQGILRSKILFISAFLTAINVCFSAQTETLMLSGSGYQDQEQWQFYCTKGRQSGYWTTIPVPSNWEFHGFGRYNYGHDGNKSDEKGRYRKEFQIPSQWQDKRISIVFEGVMTDTEVFINGTSAGPKHQGGFYEFEYDITDHLNIGSNNLLEVTVSKVSENESVEKAERKADFWIFGGIYRPVYLKAEPRESISWMAVDAEADGSFTAKVYTNGVERSDLIKAKIFDQSGEMLGKPFMQSIKKSEDCSTLKTRVNGHKTWTAESPDLYTLQVELCRDDKTVHKAEEVFGFRTFEVREKGFYLNGTRIRFKGVNRHSFWPDSGRCVNRQIDYKDAKLIKEMNMNAVRLSHYPPNKSFLQACDELGLYVIDELTGWHDAYDTSVGKKLVAEMVQRDVNHPSIMLWANGNEGGHNFDLVSEYSVYDPQDRTVIHPTPSWNSPSVFNGVDTAHYCQYDDFIKRLTERNNIFMPTEYLHGLYDGGHGAGLEDYWKAMLKSPVGAGGFLWALADEGIVRTDKNGRIDTDGNHAPDGIVGPYREKEGSFYTIKEIFCPVDVSMDQSNDFDGTVELRNMYHFTNLNKIDFTWQLADFSIAGNREKIIKDQGTQKGPDINPRSTGKILLDLPENWRRRDVLYLKAYDFSGRHLWTWSLPLKNRKEMLPQMPLDKLDKPEVSEEGSYIVVKTADHTFRFNKNNGLLNRAEYKGDVVGISNGPEVVHSQQKHRIEKLKKGARIYTDRDYTVTDYPAALKGASLVAAGNDDKQKKDLRLKINLPKPAALYVAYDSRQKNIPQWLKSWKKTEYSISTTDVEFELYSKFVSGREIVLRENNADSMYFVLSRAEVIPGRMLSPESQVSSGYKEGVFRINSSSKEGDKQFTWYVHPDGKLRLDYSYSLKGQYEYFGISFDCLPESAEKMRWFGQGPRRVWKNRLKGGWLDIWERQYNNGIPGEVWNYPVFAGYYADWYWLELNSESRSVMIHNTTDNLYFKVGEIRNGSEPRNTKVKTPEGFLCFMHAINPIGTKFRKPENLGPMSSMNSADGSYSGALIFDFK